MFSGSFFYQMHVPWADQMTDARILVFSRQLLIAHSSVINKCRHDGADLLQVIGTQVIVRIHVGMVGTCIVLHGILDKLETGQAHCIKCLVVGTTGI